MQIVGREVEFPEELRGQAEGEQAPGPVVPLDFLRALSALVMIVSGTAMIGFGVGTWLRPAAGVAAAGVCVVVFGLALAFIDNED